MINFSKEYIISAAIHYSKNCGLVPFHSVYGISDGVVITGFRHPLCIQAAVPWKYLRSFEPSPQHQDNAPDHQ